jgi:hypothetical protein
MVNVPLGVERSSEECRLKYRFHAHMQLNCDENHSAEEPSPSWLMIKFWTAVLVGAVIYCIEKSFGYCKRLVHQTTNYRKG